MYHEFQSSIRETGSSLSPVRQHSKLDVSFLVLCSVKQDSSHSTQPPRPFRQHSKLDVSFLVLCSVKQDSSLSTQPPRPFRQHSKLDVSFSLSCAVSNKTHHSQHNYQNLSGSTVQCEKKRFIILNTTTKTFQAAQQVGCLVPCPVQCQTRLITLNTTLTTTRQHRELGVSFLVLCIDNWCPSSFCHASATAVLSHLV